MRRNAEDMPGSLSLVYIAGNVAEAERVERVLTDRNVDYAISLEPFMKSSAMGTVFGGTYAGVFFFVQAGQHGTCRDLLERSGLADTVGLDESVAQGER